MLETLAIMARLARWLGPWADEERAPRVQRGVDVIAPDPHGARPMRVRTYCPDKRPPQGAYLMAPGLHFSGPDDPRMDRFCRVLANAGFLVHAPFVPDYIGMTIQPQAARDFGRALRHLLDDARMPRRVRPGIFSISFGSLVAFQLAADPELGEHIGAVVSFGGYAEWEETARFCVSGRVNGVPVTPHDPLNLPVVFIHALPALPGAPEDPQPLIDAWLTYIRAVWGREEMKHGDARFTIAHRVAPSLPASLQPLFLMGCGARPGAVEAIDHALATLDLSHLDPRPHLADVRCPVHLVHGADDDVIPASQLEPLAAALRPHTQTHTYQTGLYSHTGQERPSARDAAHELRVMTQILSAISHAGRQPRR